MRLLDMLDLPLEIDGYELEPLVQAVSSGFVRRTTVVRLRGGGVDGVGEDVTYGADEQLAFQGARATLDLAGSHTLGSLSERVGAVDLFPDGVPMEAWRDYRRWAFESAALDLALRQAGRALADAVGRAVEPVRFVVSTRLGERGVEPLRELVAREPSLRFKLDPTSDWDDRLVAELVELGRVEVVDLKGAYHGTSVDQPADAALYRRVAEAFPDAWIEDPDLRDAAAAAVLEPHRGRVTWDAPIHSVADVDALPFAPRTLNVKPSRFGSLERLLAFYEEMERRGVELYGGGQFELGPGRGQIQLLAGLFHADSGNDVAPAGYNAEQPLPGLPGSPLELRPARAGFRLADAG